MATAAYNDSRNAYYGGSDKKEYPSIWKPAIACFLLALILVFTPSSKTVYMIAASEIGEQIVTNKETTNMFSKVKVLLEDRLDDAIKQSKKGE